MKTIITTLFSICFATNVFANEIQIVNPGSEEGAFRQVLTLIGSTFEHDFIQANNPITAYSYFEDKDTLTMWSSEWPGDSSFKSPAISEKNLIGLISYETLMCSREFESIDSMANKDVKIATWGSEPVKKYLEILGKEKNINFIVVPYDGSGSMVKGFVGLDADTIFTITTRENAILESGKVNCFAYSTNGDLDFRFVDALIAITNKSELVEMLRENLLQLSTSTEWQKSFAGSYTYVGPEYIEMFNTAVSKFSK